MNGPETSKPASVILDGLNIPFGDVFILVLKLFAVGLLLGIPLYIVLYLARIV